ncbi:MAG: phospholipid carrier-dependent glycosyltransferase [bacterium]|nr:phospholipid carrier-dependent glycosyltransferase [bacterium]
MCKSNGWRFILILVVVAAGVLFFELGRMHITTDNEGQRATPPAEMLRSSDFLVPTINGRDYLVKPPLLYWLIAGVYKTTGVISPFTARIPSTLLAGALVVAAYVLLRREGGEMPARWAALTLLSAPYFLERSHWAQLDLPLTFGVFVGVVLLRKAWGVPSGRQAVVWALGSGVALAAAILFKGPPVFLFVWVAWVAYAVVSGPDPGLRLRQCAIWALGAFALECVIAFAEWLVPAVNAFVPFPVPMTMVLVAWSIIALKAGAGQRRRQTGLAILSLGVGLALSLPWGVAVLVSRGWTYVSSMLFEQVVERTYAASEINSGTPFYFLIALPVMIAPWGLLLPLHFSPASWRTHPPLYRFSVVMGWFSVLLFSLIAGKEYEYIFPAVPFLLAATAYHLARDSDPSSLEDRYVLVWQRIVLPILGVLSIGCAIYATVEAYHRTLTIETWVLALAGVACAGGGVRLPQPKRLVCVFAAALIVFSQAMLIRGYRETAKYSAQPLGVLVGDMIRAGHPVEASKVYPFFSFYVQDRLPVETDVGIVRERLTDSKPYYYVTPRKPYLLFIAGTEAGENAQVLAGPYHHKDLILIGNVPLPAGFEVRDLWGTDRSELE